MDNNLEIFIKAISEPTRLRILNYLKKECCVGELWKRLELPQNLTSHHLRVLKDAKLVIPEKRGLKVVYRLNKKYLTNNLKMLNDYLK